MKQLYLGSAIPVIMALILPFNFLHAQDVSDIKLKDFNPVSLYAIPQTTVVKAKYPVVDFHSHDYPETDAGVDAWLKVMDSAGIAKTIILSYATGAKFDSVIERYAKYGDRFEVWCGFDFTGYPNTGWQEHALAELERCYKKGAKGVGELGDKGLGEFYSHPTAAWGLHADDPQMQPLLRRCGELGMPVSIHVAEDAWMYAPADATNDGLINAGTWHVDMSKPGILDHDQLVQTLENAVRQNPGTTFIACHLANCCSNLAMLGALLDKYPNLYADIAARYGEIAPVPRYTKAFLEKYAGRIVYGTDMGTDYSMYKATFRILETTDEHFYNREYFNYHWPLHGIGLSDKALKKIYGDNAKKILRR